MTRILLLTGLCSLLALGPLGAQRASHTFEPWEASLTSSPQWSSEQRDSLSRPRGDYRYEGLAFGGVVIGALGAWLGSREFVGVCPTVPGAKCSGNGDRVGNGIAVGLVGAALGGGLGYVVGRLSPKRPRPTTTLATQPSPDLVSVPDNVQRKVGYQHWRGAGVGAATGALVGAVAGAILVSSDGCADCGEQWSTGHGAVVVGLLGAGTGSIVGFLAGLSSPKYEWVPRE